MDYAQWNTPSLNHHKESFTMSPKFLELHLLQSFVPSNLNRDDNNYPKTSGFGGARRARISSQCIKRAIRYSDAFKEAFQDQLGTRTRWLSRMLAKALQEARPNILEQDAHDVGLAFARAYAMMSKTKGKEEANAVLAFFSPTEKRIFVEKVLASWDALLEEARTAPTNEPDDDAAETKPRGRKKKDEGGKAMKELTELLHKDKQFEYFRKRTDAPDIALFGRMLTDNPDTNIAAACQVANAFSTHEVEVEYDYFTAMDDFMQEQEEAGAGMIEITGYTSACYYRYTRLDWSALRTNLNDDEDVAQRTANAFLRASVETVPTGMKNRFAQNCLPDFALAVVRSGGPGWSLANAFERPVKPNGDSGLVKPSVEALDDYWKQLYNAYEGETVKAVRFFALKPELAEAAQALNQPGQRAASLREWRESIVALLKE